MAKKRVSKFPKAFRQMAVDRLNQCENIVALAKELGVSRRLLYTWREKLEPTPSAAGGRPAHHQGGVSTLLGAATRRAERKQTDTR